MKSYLAMIITPSDQVIAKKECSCLRDAIQMAEEMAEIGTYDLIVFRQKDDTQIARFGFTSIWGIT